MDVKYDPGQKPCNQLKYIDKNRENDSFDYYVGHKMMKKKKLMFTASKKPEKWLVYIRFPIDIKLKLKDQAIKDYAGRGKQSSLINDAVKYYLFTCSDIKWAGYEKDLRYAELIDDIYEGLNQKPLENATQVFFENDVKEQLIEIEKKVKLTSPLIKDVRTGLIRKAVSIRLSIGDKAFFDSIMRM